MTKAETCTVPEQALEDLSSRSRELRDLLRCFASYLVRNNLEAGNACEAIAQLAARVNDGVNALLELP